MCLFHHFYGGTYRGVVLGLYVNCLHNIIVGRLLLQRQACTAAHKQQKQPAQQVNARDGFVAFGKTRHVADHEAADFRGFRKPYDLLLLLSWWWWSVHGYL